TRNFDVMREGQGLADRATFVIDPDGVIQMIEITPEGVGRNAVELLRKIKAAQYVREHPNEVCPAKWEEGDEPLSPSLDLVGKICPPTPRRRWGRPRSRPVAGPTATRASPPPSLPASPPVARLATHRTWRTHAGRRHHLAAQDALPEHPPARRARRLARRQRHVAPARHLPRRDRRALRQDHRRPPGRRRAAPVRGD